MLPDWLSRICAPWPMGSISVSVSVASSANSPEATFGRSAPANSVTLPGAVGAEVRRRRRQSCSEKFPVADTIAVAVRRQPGSRPAQSPQPSD